MATILIADDHEIVLLGMKLLVLEVLGNCEIDFAKDGESLLRAVQDKKYDLLILEINMPGAEGLNTLHLVLVSDPNLKVLVVSMLPEKIYAQRYFQAGAFGYIEKEMTNNELKAAIRRVSTGKIHFSQEILLGITKKQDNSFESLGDREMEVLMHLMRGKTLSEVANILGIHVATASTHKTRAFRKLGIETVWQLASLAQINNLN